MVMSQQPSHNTAEDFLCESAGIVTLCGEIDEWLTRKVIYSLYYLHGLGRGEITLAITSAGGSVLDAHGIADTIADVVRRGTRVIGRVHGLAMSAAIFPLLACSTRVASRNAMLMIHGLEGIQIADVRNQEADLVANTKLVAIQAEILGSRSNKPIDYWLPVLKDRLPTYYTATEALEWGLIDEVV